MSEQTPPIPAHRATVTPRSGDTHVIGASGAKPIDEGERKALEAKAAAAAEKRAAAAERAAEKVDAKPAGDKTTAA